MNEIRVLKWIVEVDLDETKELYRRDVESCNCLYCRNFMAACISLDVSVAAVFAALGIIPSKLRHLSEFGEMEDGLRLYMGGYHVVGKLLEGEYCTDSEWNDSNTAAIGDFTFGFNKDVTFVQNDLPHPLLQLEFEARIPWILNEQPED